MRHIAIRTPKFEVLRISKTEELFNLPNADRNYTSNLFLSFFRREISLRCGMYRNSQVAEAVNTHGNKIDIIGKKIYAFSKESNGKPVNIAFLFLNRYYPFMAFNAYRAYITAMSFYWSEFMLDISGDPVLLLLDYDEEKRKIVTGVIRELIESKKSRKFKAFIRDTCGGTAILYPDHFSERSRLFETVLRLLQDVKDYGLDYFYENHAIEILKAVCLYLTQFKADNDGKIKINLGNFFGRYAMKALRNYEKKITGVDSTPYTFKNSGNLGVAGQKHYSF